MFQSLPLKFLFSILLIALFWQCTSTQKRARYPDCTSDDIEKMDTCLLGKPLIEAIAKLKIDTSQFFTFDEPPGILRGISITLGDTCSIRIYAGRTSIMDSLGFVNYQRSNYLIIANKSIVGIAWRKYRDRKEIKRRSLGKVIWYWGD